MTKFYHKGLVFHLRYFRCATTRQSWVKRDCWSCSPPLIPSLPSQGEIWGSPRKLEIVITHHWPIRCESLSSGPGLEAMCCSRGLPIFSGLRLHPIPTRNSRHADSWCFSCLCVLRWRLWSTVAFFIRWCIWVSWFWRLWSTLVFNNSLISIALFKYRLRSCRVFETCYTDNQDIK